MEIGAIGVYLLEVSIFMLMLYVFNKWLLSRETFHSFNRYLWLATIVGSFVLPICIGDRPIVEIIPYVEEVEIPEVILGGVDVVENSSFNLQLVVKVIFALYLCGVIALLIYNLSLYGSLFGMLWRNPYNVQNSYSIDNQMLLSVFREFEAQLGIDSKIQYIIHDEEISPFSWFRYVVVSRSDIEDSCHEIVMHELSHVKQLHSLDIILANVATIILWFNPASWLVKRALQQVHEYCADEAVLQSGVNAKKYQLLLIKKSVGSRLQSISNTLNHSNLKNRITMMLKKKSSKMATAKCLYAIPVLLLLFSLLSSPTVAQGVDAVSDVKVTNNSENPVVPETESAEEPFLFVENMPKFNGGDLSTFRDWCLRSLCYPEAEAKAKVEGRVIASFWVMRDGSVGNISILKSPNEAFTNEILRLLSSSPKWTPGSQRGQTVPLKFTIPIEFSIDE